MKKKTEAEKKAAAEAKAKEKADAKAAKDKEKADAKAAKDKEKADAGGKLKDFFVAPGKAVFSNKKGCLMAGSLVKPEYFSGDSKEQKKEFDKWVEKGFIIKK